MIENVNKELLSLIGILGLPILTGVGSYIVGRRKNTTEISKTEAEIEKMKIEKRFEEVELFEKINKILAEQNQKLEAYIGKLEARIKDLEITIDLQNADRCLGDACPTKMAYVKIIDAKDKRKKKRAARIADSKAKELAQ